MFPYANYLKIGAIVLVVCGIWYNGYRIGYGKLVAYKEEQAVATAKLQQEQEAQAAQIEKEKNDQINAINNQLADALMQLRSRPSRANETAIGKDGTGLSLSAEDAAFLEREAARADGLRTALDACYKQYDALK
jgi:hypothetical protein